MKPYLFTLIIVISLNTTNAQYTDLFTPEAEKHPGKMVVANLDNSYPANIKTKLLKMQQLLLDALPKTFTGVGIKINTGIRGNGGNGYGMLPIENDQDYGLKTWYASAVADYYVYWNTNAGKGMNMPIKMEIAHKNNGEGFATISINNIGNFFNGTYGNLKKEWGLLLPTTQKTPKGSYAVYGRYKDEYEVFITKGEQPLFIPVTKKQVLDEYQIQLEKGKSETDSFTFTKGLDEYEAVFVEEIKKSEENLKNKKLSPYERKIEIELKQGLEKELAIYQKNKPKEKRKAIKADAGIAADIAKAQQTLNGIRNSLTTAQLNEQAFFDYNPDKEFDEIIPKYIEFKSFANTDKRKGLWVLNKAYFNPKLSKSAVQLISVSVDISKCNYPSTQKIKDDFNKKFDYTQLVKLLEN